MIYKHVTEKCLSGNFGIDKKSYLQELLRIKQYLPDIKKDSQLYAIINSIYDNNEHILLKEMADNICQKFKNIVIMGMGGSILNPQAIVKLQKKQNLQNNILFIDNIDSTYIEEKLCDLNLKETLFLVISKSGNTIETITQTLFVLNRFEKLDITDIGQHFCFITEDKESSLHKIADKLQSKILLHDKNIGGRYSTFTNVGLFPALICGLDIDKIKLGAKLVIENIYNIDIDEKQDLQEIDSKLPAPISASIIANLLMKNNKNIFVLMPYIEKLINFTSWYKQIWAESLGKESLGSTPICAFGSQDQHSQLQLFLDGPKDKYFTFITMLDHKDYNIINSNIDDKIIDLLDKKMIGDVLGALQDSTISTVIAKDHPVRNIIIDKLDEETLGALFAHYMLETYFTAKLMGISPFEQPAVEIGKKISKELLKEKIYQE